MHCMYALHVAHPRNMLPSPSPHPTPPPATFHRHPNIVSFYGMCVEGCRGQLCTEFCEGRDLYSVLNLCSASSGERLFGWRRRGRRIACEVARALNHLHSKSVVHLDVKSSNVLLSATGACCCADQARLDLPCMLHA